MQAFIVKHSSVTLPRVITQGLAAMPLLHRVVYYSGDFLLLL